MSAYYHTVTYTIESGLDSDEEEGFIRINGTISIHDRDNDENSVDIGSIQAFKIDVGEAIMRGDDLYADVFDLDAATENFFHVLFTPEPPYDYLPYLEETWYDLDDNGVDLLLIYDVDLKPTFKDARTELAAIYRTIKLHGHGCTIVGLCIPEERGEGYQYTRQIRDLCLRMGFIVAADPAYLLLNTSRNHGSLRDVLGMDLLDTE